MMFPAFIRDTEYRTKDKHIVSIFKCRCGNEFKCSKTRVKNGYTKSCGCLAKDKVFKIHGMKNTKEYRAWSAIKQRCLNPNNKDYYRYGAVGITVEKKWIHSFDEFFKHIGLCPDKKYSIDRINNKLGYVEGNVRWANNSLQCQNRKTSYVWLINGKKFDTSKEAGEYFGVAHKTIEKWVRGYFDKRRGTYTKPKDDCYACLRY